MTTEEFCLRLTRACRLPPGAHVLAAVSGGAPRENGNSCT